MSGKREQALRIEPKTEIHFKGPYSRVVTEYFQLTNPTEKPIAFKVKTTAPKRYCVRPNNGIIGSGKTVTVAVMLQPLGEGANPSAALLEKNKHKFMIQSVFASSETGNADDMFKSVQTEDVMDSKFRCVFDDSLGNLVPGASAVGHSGAPNNAAESDGDGSGNDKDLTEAFSGVQRTNAGANQDREPSAPSYSTASRDPNNLSNGSEDEHILGASSISSTTGHSRLPTYSSVMASDGALEVKRLQDENRDLRLKLSELERTSRSGGTAAYNRFSSTQKTAASQQQQQQSSATGVNQIEPALSTQIILTVLVSLVIGFIIGKIDFGFY